MSLADDLVLNALQIVEGEAIKRSGAGPAAAATAAAALNVLGRIAAQALAGHAGAESVAQAREHIAKLILELPGEIADGDAQADAHLRDVYARKKLAREIADEILDEINAAEKQAAEVAKAAAAGVAVTKKEVI